MILGDQKTMYGDSDTGYYDEEERFYALDAEHEVAEERRYLEEIEASHGCEFDTRPIEPEIDPETGCAAAEMSEGRAPIYPVEHERYAAAQIDTLYSEGKVA
jgi:hypothetical protein